MNSFHCNHDGSCDSVRQCCIDTEMTITRKDAERIDALGYSRSDYLVRSGDGFCELKNVSGNCYFYDDDTKACRIYENRPDGCKFYPIIYDFKKRKCVVDKDCPSRDTMSREEVRKSCKKVRRLVETIVREAAHNENPC